MRCGQYEPYQSVEVLVGLDCCDVFDVNPLCARGDATTSHMYLLVFCDTWCREKSRNHPICSSYELL